MRLLEAPSTILSLVALLLTSSPPVTASPFSKFADIVNQQLHERSEDLLQHNHTLELRSNCGASQIACGYYGQICCTAGTQSCGVNAANEAICVSAGAATTAVAGTGAGTWAVYTSTWVETVGVVTVTSVYSSWVPAVATSTAVSGNCVPNWANNESACGPICCASGQYCYDSTNGKCLPAGAGAFTSTGVTAGAPLRPTTISGMITTQTIAPTTTVPYQTPIAATSTGSGNGTVITSHSGGLSGGAIAGIVIGVIVGIIILILICLCCCLKEAFDGLLAIFGLGGGKKRSRRVVEEEYISTSRRHGSAAGSERRWYGAGAAGASASRRSSRPSRPPRSEKKSGVGGLGALGLGLGGLAVALGLKRKIDKRQEEKSDISSGYYSSYYGSNSTGSSDEHDRRSSRR